MDMNLRQLQEIMKEEPGVLQSWGHKQSNISDVTEQPKIYTTLN